MGGGIYSSNLYGKVKKLLDVEDSDSVRCKLWDQGQRIEFVDLNKHIDSLFKAPETEKEKNLRELKEKHEGLGKAIQKLEQSN